MPKQPQPVSFIHPTAGPSQVDDSLLAVRWRPGADEDAKTALVEGLGFVPATADAGPDRPALHVNRTAGLWWVRREDGKAVRTTAIGRLESSDLVEWVAPAIRPAGGKDEPGSVFAVNPTRLYVAQRAVNAMGGLDRLPAATVRDSGRATRIPGLVALRVEGASLAAGHTALDAAREIATSVEQALGADPVSAVRFENIPFLSPECRDCRPPVGEHVPDDPMFPDQWGLRRIGAPRAWEIVRGDPSVTVAVIDEGVELGHPDLDLHPQSWNASTDTPDGSPTDNHGTACAGIIAARMDNGVGPAGVAAGARIMAIATATWADIDIAEGLYFAADNGARVVSMSFGVYPWWNAWDFDLIRDALQHATDRGLVLVAASGNEDMPQSRFPGSDSRVICVGGSNRDDERKRAGDASAEPGWGACYGPSLDVVAPCLEIPTTDRLGGDGYVPGDYYGFFNGTSSATPHVAGLAALVVSLRPSLPAAAVRRVIESTCDKVSPNLYAYANVGPKPSGTWHEEVGYGRINAERALLAACAVEEEDDGGCDCTGCGGRCVGETPGECRGPSPVPWLEYDRCMFFYEGRVFGGRRQERERVILRVVYEHCLRLVGRQQGPLLYTTTLLPGETVNLYQEDRYRRVRSETERVSVHSSFRQTMAALSQSRRTGSASTYVDTLTSIRTDADTSVSAGGGLAGFFGAPSVSTEVSFGAETTVASGASLRTVADDFVSISRTSSQSLEAERSVVISSYEDAENRDVTVRHLQNDNHCYAVTYYVRRVNEVYDAHSRIAAVEWSLGNDAWRSVDDLAGTTPGVQRLVKELLRDAPRVGETLGESRQITLPTDGVAYEAELAHCSSCEPTREAEILAGLEMLRLRARRECLETDLLALELERRRELLGSGRAVALPVRAWDWSFAEQPAELIAPMPTAD